LSDADASREHVRVSRRGSAVTLHDLGAKNGTWLGEARLPSGGEAAWRTSQMVRVGRSVLALVEPVADALATIEGAPDQALPPESLTSSPPDPASAQGAPASQALQGSLSARAPTAPAQLASGGPIPRKAPSRQVWSAADLIVMAAAVGILALSLAGLVWLLRG